jgi:hypothetical protein
MSESDPVMMAVDSSGVVYHVESWPVEGGGGGGGSESEPGGGGGDGSGSAANEFMAVCGLHNWAGAVFDNVASASEQALNHNNGGNDFAQHEDAYVVMRWGSNWRGPVDAHGSL